MASRRNTREQVRGLLLELGLRFANEGLSATTFEERAQVAAMTSAIQGLVLSERNSPLRLQILSELEKVREAAEAAGQSEEVVRLAQLMQAVNDASIIE